MNKCCFEVCITYSFFFFFSEICMKSSLEYTCTSYTASASSWQSLPFMSDFRCAEACSWQPQKIPTQILKIEFWCVGKWSNHFYHFLTNNQIHLIHPVHSPYLSFTLKLQFCTTCHSAICLVDDIKKKKKKKKKSRECMLPSLETSWKCNTSEALLWHDWSESDRNWTLLFMNNCAFGWKQRCLNWDGPPLLKLQDDSTQTVVDLIWFLRLERRWAESPTARGSAQLSKNLLVHLWRQQMAGVTWLNTSKALKLYFKGDILSLCVTVIVQPTKKTYLAKPFNLTFSCKLKLKSRGILRDNLPCDRTVKIFPGCIWQNLTSQLKTISHTCLIIVWHDSTGD